MNLTVMPLSALSLSFESDIPLYLQLKRGLLLALQQGRWSDAEALPSERELSEQLSISRATVRQAILELEQEGWLVRRQGRGTFKAPRQIEQPLTTVSGFSENMRQAGLSPSSELVGAELMAPTSEIAAHMHLPPGGVVARITRVRSANGERLIVERSHLNYALLPDLLTHDLRGSLYDLLTRVYRLEFAAGEEHIGVSRVAPWISKLLGVPKTSPMLYAERLVRTTGGVPLEFSERYCHPDRVRFKVLLEGNSLRFSVQGET